jgi:hypothetical protein
MGTYYEDLKKNNPAKYADLRIAGNSDKFALKMMVKALSVLPMLNTPEDEIRLAAAKRLLRNRY